MRLVDVIPLNTVVALAIAVAKMLLVILFFMHVKYSSGLTKIVVMAGFLFLGDSGVPHARRRTDSPLVARAGPWNTVVPTILPLLRGLF